MSICTNMVSVFFPVELMIRLGRNRLFQLATNWKMACTASAGFIIGKTMVLKVWNSPEPSIRAASTTSRGSAPSRYCRRKNTTTGVVMAGMISGQ